MSRDLNKVIIAYACALIVGGLLLVFLPLSILIKSLAADIAATLVIFGFSRKYGNTSFYDAYWSVFPPLIALYWFINHDLLMRDNNIVALIVVGLVFFWAIRLTLNWATHWPGLHHEDWRYEPIREKAGKSEIWADLFGLHMFPTLIVFAALMPVYAVMNPTRVGIGFWEIIAVIITLGAILIEMTADLQLHRFNRYKQPGDYIKTGLWKYSRHPNYFGEYGFWFGLMIFGLAARPEGWWWIMPGALMMGAMFAFTSIPLMEERSLQNRIGYAEYIKKTPVFFPWFPKS